jgi:ferredoxin-NADP reductase
LQDPGSADALHFHVRRVPGGCVSTALGREILSGHSVTLMGPLGSAYLQPGLASRLVLVAEDTGFAPIWSIAAVALEEQPDRKIDLIVASRSNDFYMQPALRWLSNFANLTMTCLETPEQERPSGVACLAEWLPALSADDVVHVAGSLAMVEAVVHHASAAGALCYAEAFEIPDALKPSRAFDALGSSDSPVEEPSSESLLSGWASRRSRASRKGHARTQGGASSGPGRKPGIRLRGGLDLYLAGSLAACSALVLSTLVLVDPANTFGSVPLSAISSDGLPGQTGAMANAALLREQNTAGTMKPLSESSAPEAVEQGREHASLLAAVPDDAESRLRSGAGDTSFPTAESARDAAVAGVWAPDASACPSAQNRKRLIPAVITADGASAGDTFCAFKKKKQTETGFDVVANCSNSNQRWTANVRLTVNGNRLIWSSRRGTQTYLRCEPNLRMAEARSAG